VNQSSRRDALLAALLVVVAVIVFGVGAWWVGSAVAHGRAGMGMPMHGLFLGWGGRGWGLLALLGLAALVALGIGVLVAVLRQPSAPSPQWPAPPPAAGPGAPPGGPATPGSLVPPAPPAPDDLARLQALVDLHERGVLTDEEFAAAKRRLLGL